MIFHKTHSCLNFKQSKRPMKLTLHLFRILSKLSGKIKDYRLFGCEVD